MDAAELKSDIKIGSVVSIMVSLSRFDRTHEGALIRRYTPNKAVQPSLSMPPFNRQDTLESVRSWWSDSNLPGATIDLHAATKPLMRWMYHRQALDFIRQNHELRLSGEILEICGSYLLSKYVSNSTKIAILEDLNRRAEDADEARTVACSPALDAVLNLMGSADATLRTMVLSIVNTFMRGEPSICERLVALCLANNNDIPDTVTYALSRIAMTVNGAQAILRANVLDDVGTLLKSQSSVDRRRTCDMLGALLLHDSLIPDLLNSNVCKDLIALLWEHDIDKDDLHGCAARALSQICSSQSGAQAAVDAGLLDSMSKLTILPDVDVRTWTLALLEHLVSHAATAATTCEQLVALVIDSQDTEVIKGAIAGLSYIAGPSLAITVEKNLVALLKSRYIAVVAWACRNMGTLLRDYAAAQVLTTERCDILVALLRHESEEVVESAARTISIITSRVDGPQLLVEAKLLDYVADLLDSPNARVQIWTCCALSNLTCHGSVIHWLDGELHSKLLERLAHIMVFRADENDDVQEAAVDALRDLARVSLDHRLVEEPSDTEMVDGCPLVVIPDAAQDVIVSLQAILYSSFFAIESYLNFLRFLYGPVEFTRSHRIA
ncbi:armadillo-type protein [Mycena crocata]|nr:armadillo-type protein [Mycena crocata]